MTGATAFEDSDAVRARNADLDDELSEVLDRIPADRIHEISDGDWTLAHQLAHIGEFHHYFARQLAGWIAGDRVVVGRVAEHDADRNDAIRQAPGRGFVELRDAVTAGAARLEEVLGSLDDEQLASHMENVRYGREPMTAYLERYVTGHKAAHLRQLRETIASA